MVDVNLQNEEQIKTLKRMLDNWRMVLIPLKSVFLWEQQWHPLAIFGSVSFLYLIIWLMDLSYITTFAVLGLFINLLDFLVPIVCNTIYGANSWNGLKEKKFEDICKAIVIHYNKLFRNIEVLYSMKHNNPILHLITSTVILGTIAWVSHAMSNMFLLYLVSLALALFPGVQQSNAFKSIQSLFGFTKGVEKRGKVE